MNFTPIEWRHNNNNIIDLSLFENKLYSPTRALFIHRDQYDNMAENIHLNIINISHYLNHVLTKLYLNIYDFVDSLASRMPSVCAINLIK